MATTNSEKIHIAPSFEGGVQRRTTKFLRKVNEFVKGVNVDLQRVLGGIAKSKGYAKLGSTINSGASILGAGSLVTSGGTRKIFAFSGTDAYVYNGSSTWAAQSVGFDASNVYETQSFLDRVYIAGGTGQRIRTYNGSSFASLDFNVAPFAKYIIEYNSRLYAFNCALSGIGSFASRVFYTDLPVNSAGTQTVTWGLQIGNDLVTTASSAVVSSSLADFIRNGVKVGDPFFIYEGSDVGEYEVKTVDSANQITLTTTLTATSSNLDYWAGGNWFDVSTNNSDMGMGLGKNADRLLCFKRFSLHKFNKGTSADLDTLIQIKNVPGTTSQRSVVNMYDWTFYWSDTGLWRYDGATSKLISGPLQDIVEGISASNLSSVVGWAEKERVLKMYVGDVSNTETNISISKCVICYDVLSDNFWTESYNDVMNCVTPWVASTTSTLENYIFSSTGEAFQTPSGNAHDDVAISMEVETPFYFPIGPEVEVNFTRFKAYTQSGRGFSVQVKFAYIDGKIDKDWKELDMVKITEDEIEVKPREADPRASGYSLRFVESSTSAQYPTIERIAGYYIPGGLR